MKTWEEKDPKVDPKIDALCIEHRKKVGIYLAKFNENSIGLHEPWWNCRMTGCYDTCPIPAERDKIFPFGGIIAPAQAKEIYGDIEIDEIKEDKPKKEKKISREIEDFLWMQSRVIDKLNRHPELWRILDRLYADEIVQKLCGKSVGELVPAHYGGKMDTKVSKKTKAMFENLEKKFAEEDEKTGKKAPDYEGLEGRQMGDQALNAMLGGGGWNVTSWIDPTKKFEKPKKEKKKDDEQKKAD